MKTPSQEIDSLRRKMERQKLSVPQLARFSGVHKTSIYDMFAGLHSPTLRTIDRLKEGLSRAAESKIA
jgi:predicted transcriptional regulator